MAQKLGELKPSSSQIGLLTTATVHFSRWISEERICEPIFDPESTVFRSKCMVQTRLRGTTSRKPDLHPTPAKVQSIYSSEDWGGRRAFWCVSTRPSLRWENQPASQTIWRTLSMPSLQIAGMNFRTRMGQTSSQSHSASRSLSPWSKPLLTAASSSLGRRASPRATPSTTTS
jgi:hypothetical protein